MPKILGQMTAESGRTVRCGGRSVNNLLESVLMFDTGTDSKPGRRLEVVVTARWDSATGDVFLRLTLPDTEDDVQLTANGYRRTVEKGELK